VVLGAAAAEIELNRAPTGSPTAAPARPETVGCSFCAGGATQAKGSTTGGITSALPFFRIEHPMSCSAAKASRPWQKVAERARDSTAATACQPALLNPNPHV
jgi:hypothetical protein